MLLKGEKTKYVREAIQTLGLDTKRQEAQAWLKKKYGAAAADVAESTFYNIRRELLLQAGNGLPVLTLDGPRQVVDGHRDVVTTPAIPIKEENGIVALVKQLKLVVSKLGKNETKELVDVL